MKHILKKYLMMLGVAIALVIPQNIQAQTRNERTVHTEAELHQALISSQSVPTRIVIADDIALESTLKVQSGQDIELTTDGYSHKIGANPSANLATLVQIAAQAKLTISDNNGALEFSGTHLHQTRFVSNIGSAFTVFGFLQMSGGIVTDHHVKSSFSGVLLASGPSAQIIIDGGTIRNNTFDNQYGGIVRICDGATLTMNTGLIEENNSAANDQINNAIVYVEAEGNSSFTLNGGTLQQNRSSSGTIFIGEPANPVFGDIAQMTMRGGLIQNNYAIEYGGGLSIIGQARVSITGGEISRNEANIGGGIAVYDLYTSYGAGQDFEQWKTFFPAALELNGLTLSNNTAKIINSASVAGGYGGGIYVASDSVVIRKADISNNVAEGQGGGVYVGSTPYTIHIYDALITENTATILGGGIWLCPTGDILSAVTNGGAIFGNHTRNRDTDGAGDDFVAVPKTNKEHVVTLADRLLGGGEVRWYQDGGVISTAPEHGNVLGIADGSARFISEAVNSPIKGIIGDGSGLALKAQVDEPAQQLAASKAQVVIKGNTAKRGGGIGSNGGVIIGIPEDNWTLNVHKEWDDIINPSEYENTDVSVSIIIGSYTLDAVTLNAGNDWSAQFTQLPNPASLGASTITVIENGNAYTVDYSALSIDNDTKTLSITVTNHPLTPEVKKGSLRISKSVTGDSSVDLSLKYQFTLNLDLPLDGPHYGLEFKDGITTFELAHGDSLLLSDIPAGTRYTVTEATGDYTTESLNASGIISANIVSEARFKNQYQNPQIVTPPVDPELPLTGLATHYLGVYFLAAGAALIVWNTLKSKKNS